MTAIVTALASYLGTDLLMALLARTGLGTARARTVARVAERLIPVASRIAARLIERRNHAAEDSPERAELDEEIAALSDAQRSLDGRWLP